MASLCGHITRLSLFIVLLSLTTLLNAAPPASSLVRQFDVDDIRLIALFDGKAPITKDIYKGDTQANIDRLFKRGRASTVNVFLLRMGEAVILVDTGMGLSEENNEGGQLRNALDVTNISPDRVTHILLTHLHFDHIGGLLKNDQKVFPNATVYVSQQELNYWNDDKAIPSEEQKPNFLRAREFQRHYTVKSVEPDELILERIQVIDEKGHTPGHVGYLVNTEHHMLLLAGDLIHHITMQLANPNIYPTFDVNPEEAVETRKKILEWVAKDKIIVAGAHISFPGVVQIKKSKKVGSYTFQTYRKLAKEDEGC